MDFKKEIAELKKLSDELKKQPNEEKFIALQERFKKYIIAKQKSPNSK